MSRSSCLLLLLPIGLAACATPMPLAIELVDQQAVAHRGSIDTRQQRIEAQIGAKRYEGFFLLADGTAVTTSTGWSMRRLRTFQTVSTVSTNAGRAVLTAADGEHITCEFLIDDGRAIGECRNSAGQLFQLIAGATSR